MNTSKTRVKRWIGFLLICATMLTWSAVMAQTNAPAGGDSPPAAPLNPLSLPALIPFVTPLVVALLKGVAPKIPKVALPVLTPFVGAGLEVVLHYSGVSNIGPIGGAILGGSGVAIREFVDQLKKLGAPKPSAT